MKTLLFGALMCCVGLLCRKQCAQRRVKADQRSLKRDLSVLEGEGGPVHEVA